MPTPRTDSDPAQSFITRWKSSGGAERANYQMFLTELCDLLDVQRPDPAAPDNAENAYVFERSVPLDNRDGTTTTGFIDLYRRQHFVCETKQSVERDEQQQPLSEAERERRKRRRTGHGTRGTKTFDDVMRKAYAQAGNYARSLPPDEGRPPFLVVVDVGHTIELYSEFSQTGGTYVAFPDPQSHKITIDQLADEQIRERLRLVWTDPQQLDPARKSAAVTREIAAKLAELAKRLETSGHHAEDVAHFLMRCLFTMFAEDVNLLPPECFKQMLKSLDDPEHFVPVVQDLWQTMNTGGFSAQLRKKLLYFNGGLFQDSSAIALSRDELNLLIEAAEADWRDVEPAIFGTLLERALDPVERHKLGAHYTPRAYVERLVVPTVVEPLREEWEAARTAAMTLAGSGDTKKAVAELRRFHDRLCDVRVLDPACGSGNFLYVVLEHLKRIEGEVLADLAELGETQQLLASGHTVDPHQLLGIEINPRAAAIAELVLWIGYLQWHFRTRGSVDPPQPVIKNFKNIECRDAVLDYTSREVVLDENNKPVTIWDGRTTKPHPVTGQEVPDETFRVPMYKYLNPKKAEWPKADFVVGNPPFVGKRGIRDELGDGYVDAIRTAYAELPRNCDLVMYWWHLAAEKISSGDLIQFGLISTNGIAQSFNAQIVNSHMIATVPVLLSYVVPDHPWVDAADGADVRIAMTVGSQREDLGRLERLTQVRGGSSTGDDLSLLTQYGLIQPDLTIGPDVRNTYKIKANNGLSAVGFQFNGKGFVVTESEACNLGLGTIPGLEAHIRPFRNTSDMAKVSRNVLMIDAYGLSEEQLRLRFPQVYQWLLTRVKPERDLNKRDSRRNNWWIFGEALAPFRPALKCLSRAIGCPITSKHRFFVFLGEGVGVDSTSVMIASSDAWLLGTLSSRFHEVWALRSGSRLGVGNDPRYNKTRCFERFPFPDASDSQKARIRELGEQLDAHRKRQQQLHPKLTMTGMYNVLEKLRSEEPLTTKEREIHEWGLVSVLRQIHDDLDAAVAEAYGWPVDLTDEEILERLVALNHQRAEEEKRGLIRWLRPEYQNPEGVTQRGITTSEDTDDEPETKKSTKGKAKAKEKIKKQKWPTALSEQAAAVALALTTIASPADDADVAKHFTRANRERIAELLETLESLGKVRQLPTGKYVAI